MVKIVNEEVAEVLPRHELLKMVYNLYYGGGTLNSICIAHSVLKEKLPEDMPEQEMEELGFRGLTDKFLSDEDLIDLAGKLQSI